MNQTTTLQANTSLNLDTGGVAATGGDLLWSGSTITPQGRARAANLGALGAGAFESYTEAVVRPLLVIASQAPIPASALVVNDFFVALTNGNNVAKVLVTAKSGTTITLRFTTYIAATPTGPTITAVQNNSSRIPAGFPNHGIAPSSLFVVVGSGLADAGEPQLQSSANGIPLSLNGASITVVVNGVTTRPPLWYTSPRQLAAVLPAATPMGNGTLTVTYRGVTSAPAPIQVVPAAVGINFYNSNTGVATDAVTGAVLTVTNSGFPGQNIVLWATGLGADPADSDTTFTTTPHAVATPLQIFIGGLAATILYQGASGYPGVNQINVTIPPSVATGCSVALVAVTGVVVSNSVTLPIKSGGGACVESLTGVNGQQVASANVRTGLVSLVQTNRPPGGSSGGQQNAANAAFGRYDGLAAAATGAVPSPGGCVVAPVVVGGPVTFTGLDAGVITLAGPNGLAVTLGSQGGLRGAYGAVLAGGAIPATGGIFTFRGAGGADVGSFNTTVELANPLLQWTNQSVAATIDRSQGVVATWTGGNPGTYVAITGTSVTANSGGAGPAAGFTCLARAEDGRFTVPSYILQAMPAGPGGMEVQNIIYSPFTASGVDIGLAAGTIAYTISSTYR